jgi:hypothetical protein
MTSYWHWQFLWVVGVIGVIACLVMNVGGIKFLVTVSVVVVDRNLLMLTVLGVGTQPFIPI